MMKPDRTHDTDAFIVVNRFLKANTRHGLLPLFGVGASCVVQDTMKRFLCLGCAMTLFHTVMM